jgi:hypothetical protein
MRSFGFGIAVSFAALVAAAPIATAAADPPTDLVCPRAVPKLVEFHDASARNDGAKILAAIRGAVDAYMTCLSEAKTRTYEEPYMNYDRTRAAQFLVVEGRVLAAVGDTKSAVAALRDAHALAQEVVAWQPMGQTYTQSSDVNIGNNAYHSTDHKGSRYLDAAKAVLSAADDELVRLNVPARRQAPPTPSP